ncbi:hypothetical protein CROQUDRAFT_721774 [Cronartium quercuum f. sp. fusiforme G11]|uniref:Uncharacterized protein n=1 Tax=Cronartium quercuum f. sp. fusiforme G11 TaxID=708437 RepID=A0A9P6NQE5_9BASI|nr:hypothetical protein CROQUDRAFT_721774 [Cronartium quercuum f. sp. fusiforme G11]
MIHINENLTQTTTSTPVESNAKESLLWSQSYPAADNLTETSSAKSKDGQTEKFISPKSTTTASTTSYPIQSSSETYNTTEIVPDSSIVASESASVTSNASLVALESSSVAPESLVDVTKTAVVAPKSPTVTKEFSVVSPGSSKEESNSTIIPISDSISQIPVETPSSGPKGYPEKTLEPKIKLTKSDGDQNVKNQKKVDTKSSETKISNPSKVQIQNSSIPISSNITQNPVVNPSPAPNSYPEKIVEPKLQLTKTEDQNFINQTKVERKSIEQKSLNHNKDQMQDLNKESLLIPSGEKSSKEHGISPPISSDRKTPKQNDIPPPISSGGIPLEFKASSKSESKLPSSKVTGAIVSKEAKPSKNSNMINDNLGNLNGTTIKVGNETSTLKSDPKKEEKPISIGVFSGLATGISFTIFISVMI